jgi:hypothetical protein
LWSAPSGSKDATLRDVSSAMIARANRLGTFFINFDELVASYLKHHGKAPGLRSVYPPGNFAIQIIKAKAPHRLLPPRPGPCPSSA